ncbi:uncharacterized protein BO88DRAFT_427254 [Aspergillus vadensis CBS 113365]|uniref:Uncharacterized protein n=1 Tax=Aspergillus vadensis (strain CBS 113365 / IMI 142717 / IBT 24658) TaxID=1448311 RepID=A0A319B5A5_ASPVC|nr:hypothetical protein BO88DRAFT_427254 [Aspergillus vadensis CBS 113365]PYH67071.1 hypothetical protein BO88DRAFT_427254 [Aspergillus vadensis CBS 113365]
MTSVRSKLIDSIQDHLDVLFKNSPLIPEAPMAAGVYITSISGTDLLSTFSNLIYIVDNINPAQLGNFVPDKLMAITVEVIAGAVFLETSWVRAALQRIADALGLAWPDS